MRLHYLAKLLLTQSTRSNGIIVIKLVLLAGVSGLADIIASTSAYSHQVLTIGQLEARRYTSIINSAQIKYYQKNHHFANSLGQLNTGISEQTSFYTYHISVSKVPMIDPEGAAEVSAVPLTNRPYLKKIDGEAVVLPSNGSKFTFITKRCEAIVPFAQGSSTNNFFGVMQASNSSDKSVSLSCIKGFRELKG